MAIAFYMHDDGRLRMRADAGGHGGGVTGAFDGFATEADIAAYQREYAAWLASAAPEAEDDAEPVARKGKK